jgi:hypothetical protein
MLERDLIRQRKHASFRDHDEFGVSAVAMFADHFGARAKLLVPRAAEYAVTARNEVVKADAIAGFEIGYFSARLFNYACHFVPEGERHPRDRRHAGAIMRVGVTNARGANPNQNVLWAYTRDIHPLLFQWRADCDQANCFHRPKGPGDPACLWVLAPTQDVSHAKTPRRKEE